MSTTTDAAEVLAVVDWLESRSVVHQINGGWAVDALVGRRTREHRDLDVFVDDRAVDALLVWLLQRGYAVAEDWRPVRVELRGDRGRVDVHPMRILDSGDGLQAGFGDEEFQHPAASRTRGTIEGCPVVVADAARLLELRQGYEPRPEDLHDISLLEDLLRGPRGDTAVTRPSDPPGRLAP